MNAPSGTLLVFATNPDNVASDGTGKNRTYTKHLLQYIKQPGLEVGMMLRKIRTVVKEETGGQQVPWEHGSIEGEFYFNSTSSVPLVALPISQQQALLSTPLPPVTETMCLTSPSPSGDTQVAVGVYPEAPQTLRNSVGMEFVLIPTGEFQMGSNDANSEQKPVHTVRPTKKQCASECHARTGQHAVSNIRLQRLRDLAHTPGLPSAGIFTPSASRIATLR
jgi:hypothetical protein